MWYAKFAIFDELSGYWIYDYWFATGHSHLGGVPSYSGIPGNEQSDHLAKTASIGPEPALPNVVKTAIRQWAYVHANNRWQNIKTCQQAKLMIQGYKSNRTRELLRLHRQKLRLATGILTGHSQLNRHLSVMGIISDPTCNYSSPLPM